MPKAENKAPQESDLKGIYVRGEILNDQRLSPLEWLAVGYIEYRARKSGEYWEKPDKLANFFKVTPRYVATILEDLIRTGYIVKTGQIRNRHIVYQVPQTMNHSSYFETQTMNHSSEDSMNHSSDYYIYKKQEEENNAHLRNAQENVDLFGEAWNDSAPTPESVFPFADFWTIYPRKVDKKRAETIYRKLPEATRALIKERLPLFVKECQGKEPGFIAHPSTWLNGERWLDEPAAPAVTARTTAEIFDSIHF